MIKSYQKKGRKKMFFSKPGEYEPCGIFTINHFKLIIITIICITIGLKNTINKNKEEVKKIIKNSTKNNRL